MSLHDGQCVLFVTVCNLVTKSKTVVHLTDGGRNKLILSMLDAKSKLKIIAPHDSEQERESDGNERRKASIIYYKSAA